MSTTSVVVIGGLSPLAAHAAIGTASVQKGSPAINNGTHTIVVKGTGYSPGVPVTVKLTRDLAPNTPSGASRDALTGTGTVGSDLQTVTASVNFAQANPGTYAVALYEGSSASGQPTDSCDSCFTVLSFPVSVTGVSPSALGGGTSSDGFGSGNQVFGFQPFVITGQNFAKGLYSRCTSAPCSGPSVAAFQTGTTTNDSSLTLGQTIAKDGTSTPTNPTATTISLRASVANSATDHFDDIVVTNSDGQSDTCVACLHITPRPTITSIENAGLTGLNPANKVGQGATNATLLIHGDNFPSDASAYAFHSSSPGDDPGTISWTVSAPVADPTGGDPNQQTITLSHVNTSDVNDVGAWQVYVTSAGQHSLSAPSTLTVTDPPTGTGLSYVDTNGGASKYGQGATNADGDNLVKVDVTVDRSSYYAGSGSTPHTTVQFLSLPGGVQVTDEVAQPLPAVTGDGTVEVTLAIGQNGTTPNPTTGTYHLVVVNPDGGRSGTCTSSLVPASDDCFLTVSTGPKITGISNNYQAGGSSTSVTITSASDFPSGLNGVHVRIGPAGSPFVDGDFTRVGDSDPTGSHHNQVVATGVAVPGGTDLGDYPVVVTDVNDRGTYTVANGFHVVALTVSGVSPNFSLNNSSAKSLAISGAGFAGDASAVLHPSFLDPSDTSMDIAGSSPAVTDSGHTLTSTFDLANESPGDYDVLVSQGSGSGGCSQCFALLAAAPTISQVSPTGVGRGAKNVTVTVTGTNIYPGATVTFSDPAVHLVGSPTVTGTTQITQKISVDPGSSATTADQNDMLTVTDSHSASDVTASDYSVSHAFPISAGPSVSDVSPSKRAAGSPATPFTITGTGFDPDNSDVQFSDNGVTLSNISRTATSISGTLHIASNVASNAPVNVDVTVVNPDDGTATSPVQLVVDPQPVVDAFDPSGVATGSQPTLVITGSNFYDGVTVAPSAAGSGLTFDTPVVQSPNEIDVPVTVASDAPLGTVDIDVTNDDAGTTSAPLDVFTTPGNVTNLNVSGADGVIDVAWNAPTSDGGSDISSYTVYAVNHADAAQSPDPITVSDGCSDSSVTEAFCAEFQGLDAGTRYDVTVVPTNEAGNGPAVGTFVTPKYDAALTIASSQPTIVFGQTATLFGVLSRPNGPSVPAGETVQVYRQPPASTAVFVGDAATDDSGNWSLPVKPAHNATYYASYAGSADTSAVQTSGVLQRVASKVGVSKPKSADNPLVVAKGDSLNVTGKVSPDKAGQKVHLVLLDPNRTVVDTTKLSPTSGYKFTEKLSRGHYTFEVTIGKTTGNAPGVSRQFTVKQQ